MYERKEPLPVPSDFSFPYAPPYRIQIDFMKQLFTVLESKAIGIFESPTGTGKSLSLTCGALQWLHDHKALFRSELQTRLELIRKEITELEITNSKTSDWISGGFEIVQKKSSMAELNRLLTEVNKYDERIKDIIEKRTIEFNRKKQFKELAIQRSNSQTLNTNPTSDSNPTVSDVDGDDFLIDIDDDDEYDFNQDSNEKPYADTKIFYCSRTHSQLSQVVNEIKKTEWNKTVKVVSLASRQHYCVNESVKNLKSSNLINERCLQLQKNSKKSNDKKTLRDNHGQGVKKLKLSKCRQKCDFYSQTKFELLRGDIISEVMDIEETIGICKSETCCPYYASRYSVSDADIVFLPYQMLLHKRTRDQLGLQLEESVIIIDEAHNLLDSIMTMNSATITLGQLSRLRQQLMAYKKRYISLFRTSNLLKLNQIIFVATRLEKFMQLKIAQLKDDNNIQPSSTMKADELMMQSDFFNIKLSELIDFSENVSLPQKLHGFALSQGSNLNATVVEKRDLKKPDRSIYLKELAAKQKQPITKKQNDENIVMDSKDLNKIPDQNDERSIEVLRGFLTFLECLNTMNENARIIVNCDKSNNENSYFKYFLLSPKGHFDEILGKCRSMIIAGGTMRPTNELHELLDQASGKTILEFCYEHVVPNSSVCPIVLTTSSDGKSFVLNYTNRNSFDMLNGIGESLVGICNTVPAGVVCFFVSYNVMESVYDFLKNKGFLDRIQMKKSVFKEPRHGGTSALDNMLLSYTKSVKRFGAILFCVVGGKLSEGINFSDDLGRCVVVIGMPYPNKNGPELVERIQYLNHTMERNAGDECYENICIKAVNQCIGRSVRHINDYAAIVLIDQRYKQDKVIQKLPNWIRKSGLKIPNNYNEVLNILADFFKNKN